jgi:FtsP/CotA-like multicopper oxidase with cupredoxin domain
LGSGERAGGAGRLGGKAAGGVTRFTTFTLALILCAAAAAANAQAPAGAADIFSSGGVLTATLAASEGKVQVGDLSLDTETFNGVYAGPVLHVHPGDLMRLTLVNHLSEPTNLHFHGIRTSPLGNGDNAHLQTPPGGSFEYRVRIPPNHPTGLFWYHTHVHHHAEHQVMSGLSGALLVEPPVAPPIVQRLFVLKDMTFDDDTGTAEIDDTLNGVVESVNGILMTKQDMRPGETQLWRFSNQSANRLVHIALAGHRFRIVAEDGTAVTEERDTEVLDLPPGNRFDALVDAGDVGHYQLSARGILTGSGATRSPDRVIGMLDVEGDIVPAAAALPLGQPPPDLRSVRIDAKREVVFTETTTTKASEQRFFINGKQFDERRIDFRVPLGNVEEWTIRNDSDDLHVFHIHQIGFQVIEVNGEAKPFSGYVDTIRVPERGQVKLILPFTDPIIVGHFMFHCHVLKHEDGGMMGNIQVYDPAPPSFISWLNGWYIHFVWWWNGVPWSLCGLHDA